MFFDSVMFCEVVSVVIDSFLPEDVELLLCLAVPQPIVAIGLKKISVPGFDVLV